MSIDELKATPGLNYTRIRLVCGLVFLGHQVVRKTDGNNQEHTPQAVIFLWPLTWKHQMSDTVNRFLRLVEPEKSSINSSHVLLQAALERGTREQS